MNIIRIPHTLFQEFSQKFGLGEERHQISDRYSYLFRELNPEIAGFPGAVGIRDAGSKNEPCFIFVLWGLVPRGKEGVFESKPVLTITALAEMTGVWEAGRGCRMKGTCKAEFSFYGMYLRSPSSKLIPLILQRGVELASQAQTEEFWEREQNPEGDFSKPPR